MFDFHRVLFDYHALDEETDEALTSCEIKIVDTGTEGFREGADIVAELIESSATDLLGTEPLLVGVRCVTCGLQALAPCF